MAYWLRLSCWVNVTNKCSGNLSKTLREINYYLSGNEWG